jgi:uncharacterized membrane protein YdfJ with MMPL/SSD domain
MFDIFVVHTLMTPAGLDLIGRWFWLLQVLGRRPKPAQRAAATELKIE